MKSSKALARKILCGLLAAGVVGMSGSALAASAIKDVDRSHKVKDKTTNQYVYDYKDFNEDIELKGKYSNSSHKTGLQLRKSEDKNQDIKFLKNVDISITNKGNIASAIYVYTNKSSINSVLRNYIGSKDTDHINLNVKGNKYAMGLYLFNSWGSDKPAKPVNGSYTEINSRNLNIDVHSDSSYAHGIYIGNNTTDLKGKETTKLVINADNTVINVSSDVKIDPDYKDNHSIGIAAYSQGEVEINGNLTINADTAINTRGHSTVTINKDNNGVIQLNGDIIFDVTNDGNSGLIADSKVNLNLSNEKSSFNGSVKTNKSGSDSPQIDMKVTGMDLKISNDAAWNMTGDSFVNNADVSNGGSINVQEGVNKFDAGNLKLENANLNLQGNNQNVTVDDLQGNSGKITTNSLSNNVTIGEDKTSNLTVNGTKEVTDAIANGEADLQKLADVVKSNDKSAADTVTSDANDIIGGYSAKVLDGKVVDDSVKTVENATNRAISDIMNISLMTWRQENNDMNKRLGELRDSKGEHGAWARMARGESKYGAHGVKNQYNYYQVGYDEKLSTNPNWTVGVALTRTEGNSTFAAGSGENKHTGLAIYGSYLSDSGSFVDLIAKYARLDNEFKTVGAGVGDADYKENAYSLSAEYGKRFTGDNGFWIEPQVELTYGTVGSVDYLTNKGYSVHKDSTDSLVGRLGFALGKNIKQGNVYVRASYLYDFDGESTVTMGGAGTASFKQDLGGGWWEVGVGTNLNLSEATHLYFDVEKTYGGNVATPWQWNAGVRWSF